jgi:hypothetical protein
MEQNKSPQPDGITDLTKKSELFSCGLPVLFYSLSRLSCLNLYSCLYNTEKSFFQHAFRMPAYSYTELKGY